jgi:hypothetical protein
MEKDTQKALEEFEKALRTETKELTEEDLLADLGGIFDELSDPVEVDDNAVYSNNTNDYTDDLEDFANQTEKRVYGPKLTLGLMLTACALCLAIIGVMIYWLNNFF